jgi:actin-related protein
MMFLQISPAETSLLITEPYFNLPIIQDLYDQFVFEEYEFNSYHRCARQYACSTLSKYAQISFSSGHDTIWNAFQSILAFPPIFT